MKRKDIEKRVCQWESEGYDVSEFRNKWSLVPDTGKVRGWSWSGPWSLLVAVALIMGAVLIVYLAQPDTSPAPASAPTPTPAPTTTTSSEPTPASEPTQAITQNPTLTPTPAPITTPSTESTPEPAQTTTPTPIPIPAPAPSPAPEPAQTPTPSYSLFASVNPSGTGSVSPSSGNYDSGATVGLTANPVFGYRFDSWGGDVSGTSPTLEVTMDSNKTVVANFSRVRYSLMTSISPQGNGSISPSSGTYDSGTVVTLTATPSSGYEFDRWSGDASGTSPSFEITMDSNKNVVAYFAKIPPPPFPFGKIAFASRRDGNYEIYIMNADGSHQTKLTNNPAVDRAPAWSPDGTKIAFVSDRSGDGEIWIMNADGSNLIQLTREVGVEALLFPPIWLPDGSKVIFAGSKGSGLWSQSQIWIVNSDGSSPRQLEINPQESVNNPNLPSDVLPLTISPDGARILFRGDDGLCVMNLDGTNFTWVLTTGGWNRASWSADGKKLVLEWAASEIYLVNPDGSGLEQIASGASPSWSPDGRMIAFSKKGNIYIMDVSARTERRVIDDGFDTSWAPY